MWWANPWIGTGCRKMSQKQLQVWVLAASTGGVAAVPRFLSRIPRLPHVAFVYVQHLVVEQHRHLLEIVRRHCDWQVTAVNYGCPLVGGSVVVPSAEERFDIGEDGLVGVIDGAGWQPPYSPCIDDVAVQVGRYYRKAAGIVVFTGMGRDGAHGSREIDRRGGRVWVQAPATCAAVSMPESVLGMLCPAATGDVDELADKFNREYAMAPQPGARGERG